MGTVHEDASEENVAQNCNVNSNLAASGDVAKLMAKDAEDESLRKYKERLLGLSTLKGDIGNVSDPRKVVLMEFHTIIQGDHPNFQFDLSDKGPGSGKDAITFDLKEGCKYRLNIVFKVQHQIVSGLRFCLRVRRALVKKSEEIVMGSYGPRTEPHLFEYPRDSWLAAPKGKLARGTYKAQLTLLDLDGAKHLQFEFVFKIIRST